MPNVIKGRKITSIKLTGRKIPRHIVEKVRIKKIGQISKRRKKIIQCDLKGNIISEYESITSAINKSGISKSTIYRCLNGKKLSFNGIIFKYKP